ncbi:MAG: thioredoxin family protein [Candidatus Obscuribacterales bacterium]|nr:thioredoxin family protein [Candidatus Obscuribacterales bacterium]
MWNKVKSISMVLAGFFLLSNSNSNLKAESPNRPDCRIVTSRDSLSPGESLKIGVEFKIPEGAHIYFREAGDTGRATTVELTLPDGSSSSELLWPRPERLEEGGLVSYAYKNQVVLSFKVQLPANFSGERFKIKARVSWLLCGNDNCVPGKSELELELPVRASSNASAEAKALEYEVFLGKPEDLKTSTALSQASSIEPAKAESLSLPYALMLSFLAGMLLNLMPCVLPVIALKVMSLTKQAGGDRKSSIKLGSAYTAGTLATFAALATIIVSARALGKTLGWGFQFQSLTYLVGMCSLVCVMTLSLFGLFFVQIQTGVNSLEKVGAQNGMLSAFAKGISATLLSTPCSAPLLGTALGFALSQSALWIFAVLLSVGLGLAFPYLLLSCFPSWLRFLPKPGEWMERFKEAMGFLMLGTLLWLLNVVASVGGSDALLGTLSFLFCLIISAWGYVRFAPQDAGKARRLLVAALAISLSGWAFYQNVWTLKAKSSEQSQGLLLPGVSVEAYSQEALERHLQAGKIVFVDAGAEWCLTCKMNEQVLSSSSVLEAMKQNNVVVLQADWTNGAPQVTALIQSFQRPGVPLYVVYSPFGRKPQLLPELITPSIVTDAIRAAAK